MALDHFFEAKCKGCDVRAKARALKHEGTKAVRWPRTVETRRGNKTMIESLTDQDGCVLHGSEQICAAFHLHFAQLFGVGDGSTMLVRTWMVCRDSRQRTDVL